MQLRFKLFTGYLASSIVENQYLAKFPHGITDESKIWSVNVLVRQKEPNISLVPPAYRVSLCPSIYYNYYINGGYIHIVSPNNDTSASIVTQSYRVAITYED